MTAVFPVSLLGGKSVSAGVGVRTLESRRSELNVLALFSFCLQLREIDANSYVRICLRVKYLATPTHTFQHTHTRALKTCRTALNQH